MSGRPSRTEEEYIRQNGESLETPLRRLLAFRNKIESEDLAQDPQEVLRTVIDHINDFEHEYNRLKINFNTSPTQ